VDAGEPILAALAREIQEECGMRLVEVLGEYGSMVEYDLAEEPDMDYFVMTSHYYRVRVDGTGGAQRLDDYERELGFRPEWVEINAAIANNRAVYAENRPGRPKWIPRDLYVLEHLRDGSGGL
jgi:8-oxo-dGTP pyrophosphatase MutT (NUDIX family)